MKPRTLILRTAGVNCDEETAHAFQLAGAETQRLHINELLADAKRLDQFQIMAFPGGFSYGDDIAAGRILANQIAHHLRDAVQAFIDSGRPIIGICNGFQVLVKTDLLPGALAGRTGQTCTLAHNDCGRFVDRWVTLAAQKSKCIWTRDLPATIELPIAHGEGKFVAADDDARRALWDGGQVALTYSKADGTSPGGAAPDNPNGSQDDIAGVCDGSGLVLGLMPHPERFIDFVQHPAWTSRSRRPQHGDGLKFFQNAVAHVREAVGAGV